MTRNKYRWLHFSITVFLAINFFSNAYGQLTVVGGQTALNLAQTLAGPGISVSNATLTGAPDAAGLFDGSASNIGVNSGCGCKDTIAAKVEIEPIFTFYIPNAFTPDADGVNEEFFGDGEGFTTYTMTIYNRWGEQIFFSNDPDKKWDGTHMGKQVEQGVYIYYFYVLDWNNNDHEYRGHVTLMR